MQPLALLGVKRVAMLSLCTLYVNPYAAAKQNELQKICWQNEKEIRKRKKTGGSGVSNVHDYVRDSST